MGYQNENGMRIVFDIETAPMCGAADYLIEPVEAPSNYKDLAKIAAFIAEKKAEQFGKCGLDPDLCQVVAIGLWAEADDKPVTMLLSQEREEHMLAWFWGEAEQGHLVGFNCGAFDLPVLLRRSLYLGVKPRGITIHKYRHPDYTDLMTHLSFEGMVKAHSLDFYAKRFGCTLTDAIDGTGIGLAVAEGRWDEIEQHCTNDVRRTAFVAEKCGYFRPQPVTVF